MTNIICVVYDDAVSVRRSPTGPRMVRRRSASGTMVFYTSSGGGPPERPAA